MPTTVHAAIQVIRIPTVEATPNGGPVLPDPDLVDLAAADFFAFAQRTCGGHIERVTTEYGDLWINEDGKGCGLPASPVATVLADGCLFPGDYIAGPAVLASTRGHLAASAPNAAAVLHALRAAAATLRGAL